MQTNTPSNFTLADGAGHTFFERRNGIVSLSVMARAC